MNIYFDFEFTGLHQNTTPISVGLISDDEKTFYAEFVDFDRRQLTPWIRENVLLNLLYSNGTIVVPKSEPIYAERWLGDCEFIGSKLRKWLQNFDSIRLVSDCMYYDYVLLCEFFGGSDKLPRNINYIGFDICNLFQMKGIDPDINREEFLGIKNSSVKHNSLYDAEIIRKCYRKLISMDWVQDKDPAQK
jgi:hypothetical protein